MPRFRKKPVVIEAMQFTGNNGLHLREWSNFKAFESPVLEPTPNNPTGRYVQIQTEGMYEQYRTLEGTIGKKRIRTPGDIITAIVGDWIIRGVEGEYYPCKPDIFEATYGPVEAPDA